jgi:hypothetical protein
MVANLIDRLWKRKEEPSDLLFILRVHNKARSPILPASGPLLHGWSLDVLLFVFKKIMVINREVYKVFQVNGPGIV